jgi:hypothetical protein
VEWTTILKWRWEKLCVCACVCVCVCEDVDWINFVAVSHVNGYCEKSNEHSGPIKVGIFIE